MNNKDFGQFIKKSMEGLNDGTPSNWSAMEQRLNMNSDSEMTSEMEDIYLDGVAYDHLNNLQEPYEPANWDKMSARLDEDYAYRRKVVITKSMEVLVVLLLLWTGINFFPNKKAISTPTPPVAEHQATSTTPEQILSEKSTSNLTNNITTSTSSTESILADNSIAHNLPTGQAGNTSTVSTKTKEVPTMTNENHFFYALEDFSLENEKPTISNLPSIESSSLSLKKTMDSNLAISDALKNQPTDTKQGILKKTLLAIISPIKSLKPSLLKSDKTKEVDLEKMLAMRKAKSKGLIVSMFGSSDYNMTTTPYYDDNTRTNKNFHRSDLGYGGGVTIGFQTKKLFIETGLIYNFARYEQFDSGSITGGFESYTAQKLTKAEINLIQIPLHFQYRIYQHKRWNIYGLAGGSLNLAVQNNFEFQETNLTETGYRSSGAKELSDLLPNYDGILEGGDLKTNSYLTANFGIGIERYFSYRWSMFVQPIYRYNLFFDGIGPKDDYLNSGSIQIGTKVRLRK